MPHPIYVNQYFLHDIKVLSVVGRKFSDRDYMKYDEVRATVEGKNGLGTIFASCNSNIHGDTLDIFGTKKEVHVDITARTVTVYGRHKTTMTSIGIANLQLSGQSLRILGATTTNMIKAATGKQSAHYLLINQFINSLRDGSEFIASPENGRECVRILDPNHGDSLIYNGK